MPLIPSSPAWDAYVAELRSQSVASWTDWCFHGSRLNDLDRYPSLWLHNNRTQRAERKIPHRVHIRTRSGSGRNDHGIDIDDVSKHRVIADDWNTLDSWIPEWFVRDNDLFVEFALTPNTIWCQDIVVVLTEQLADLFCAPPGMDTSDITAWLRLFRLPDTVDARVVLSRFIKGGDIVHAGPAPQWCGAMSFQRCVMRRVESQRPPIRPFGDASPGSWPSMSLVCHRVSEDVIPEVGRRVTYEAPLGARLPGNVISAGEKTNMIQHDDRTTVVSDSAQEKGTPIRWVNRARDVFVFLTPDGFESVPITRPVPLDISLLAHAGTGCHTVQPCR